MIHINQRKSLIIKQVFEGYHTSEQFSTNRRTYTLKALASDVISLDKKSFQLKKQTD